MKMFQAVFLKVSLPERRELSSMGDAEGEFIVLLFSTISFALPSCTHFWIHFLICTAAGKKLHQIIWRDVHIWESAKLRIFHKLNQLS